MSADSGPAGSTAAEKTINSLMISRFALIGLVVSALALGACTDAEYKSLAASSAKANARLSPEVMKAMAAKGMTKTSPILGRIFKEEGKVEVWKQKTNGRYDIIASYDICKFSGKLGPKYIEGDRQAPEGFYTVRPGQMNPNSSYHLSFNIGYPNAYDRANGRTGSNLMVHGACSSSGCYSMTDGQMEQIFAFARDAFAGGQTEFQIQAFPFRMTAANMARYKNDPNYPFWQMLKEGYDHFELTKVPPKVDVCEKRYVFNRTAQEGYEFNATAACPPMTQPEPLAMAYQSHKAQFEAELATVSTKTDLAAPKASIIGLKEAGVVSDWTKRRARGERVSVEPPSLGADGAVVTSGPMGRADNEAGRKMAALEAAEAAKKKAAEEKAARVAAEKAAKELAAAEKLREKANKATANAKVEAAPAPVIEAEAPAEETRLGRLGKRIGNLFGS